MGDLGWLCQLRPVLSVVATVNQYSGGIYERSFGLSHVRRSEPIDVAHPSWGSCRSFLRRGIFREETQSSESSPSSIAPSLARACLPTAPAQAQVIHVRAPGRTATRSTATPLIADDQLLKRHARRRRGHLDARTAMGRAAIGQREPRRSIVAVQLPSDPYFPNPDQSRHDGVGQWHLLNIGQEVGNPDFPDRSTASPAKTSTSSMSGRAWDSMATRAKACSSP